MTQQGAIQATREPKTLSGSIDRWLGNPDVERQIVGALAGYIDAATFRAQCVLAARDPILADCEPASVLSAFLVCAQMGLLPGKHHSHVALIPRKGVCTVMPQWQGLKFLMERQPGIKRVTPKLVHVSDEFEWDEVTGELVHRFDPFASGRTFCHPADGKDGATGLRGGYLKIEYTTGEIGYHFVPAQKVEFARECSQTPDKDKYDKPGVWRLWYAEQAYKTVLRDAWARRVISIETTLEARIADVVALEDRVLENDPQRRSDDAPVPKALEHQPQPSAVDALAETLGVGKAKVPAQQEPRQAPQTAATAPRQSAAEEVAEAGKAFALDGSASSSPVCRVCGSAVPSLDGDSKCYDCAMGAS